MGRHRCEVCGEKYQGFEEGIGYGPIQPPVETVPHRNCPEATTERMVEKLRGEADTSWVCTDCLKGPEVETRKNTWVSARGGRRSNLEFRCPACGYWTDVATSPTDEYLKGESDQTDASSSTTQNETADQREDTEPTRSAELDEADYVKVTYVWLLVAYLPATIFLDWVVKSLEPIVALVSLAVIVGVTILTVVVFGLSQQDAGPGRDHTDEKVYLVALTVFLAALPVVVVALTGMFRGYPEGFSGEGIWTPVLAYLGVVLAALTANFWLAPMENETNGGARDVLPGELGFRLCLFAALAIFLIWFNVYTPTIFEPVSPVYAAAFVGIVLATGLFLIALPQLGSVARKWLSRVRRRPAETADRSTPQGLRELRSRRGRRENAALVTLVVVLVGAIWFWSDLHSAGLTPLVWIFIGAAFFAVGAYHVLQPSYEEIVDAYNEKIDEHLRRSKAARREAQFREALEELDQALELEREKKSMLPARQELEPDTNPTHGTLAALHRQTNERIDQIEEKKADVRANLNG